MAIRADVLSADPEVTTGRMLVSRGIKIRGKVFALRSAQNLVVKLPAAQIARLVETGCGVPFRSGSRVLKQWVSVPATSIDDWHHLARQAKQFVGRSGG